MTSPLDSLKDAFWKVRSHIEYSTDHLAGNGLLNDGHHVYNILDDAVKELTVALGEHVPGVIYDLSPRFYGGAWEDARTYDDGTPVVVTVKLDNGNIADYRPRHDGDYTAWRASFGAHLTAVEAVS